MNGSRGTITFGKAGVESLFLLVCFLSQTLIQSARGGFFATTGDLNYERSFHTATLLPNGKVLVAGGSGNGGINASAEIYDPSNGTWTLTGSLATARTFHSATLLTNGEVIVIGGGDSSGKLVSAEIYNPSAGIWRNAGTMQTARQSHTATLLPNGLVLVTGGYSPDEDTNYWDVSVSSVELYDPANQRWTTTNSMSVTRSTHTARLLPDGRVLIAGDMETARLTATQNFMTLTPAFGIREVSCSTDTE